MGIGDCGDADPATYEVSLNNTASGYVAMWTNITPTGDGGISFAVRQDNYGTGTVLRLAQAYWITGEEPPLQVSAPESFTLTVNSGPGGSVSPTGGTYLADSVIAISATASSYFHFVNWTGDFTSIQAVTNLILNTNKTIWAVFAETLATNRTPHWWLAGNGFPTSDEGALQTGANGMAAWESYIAGVDPGVATSAFNIAWFSRLGSTPVFSWPAVPGRHYSLLWAATPGGPYTTLVADALAAGSYTDTVHGAEEKGFYQLQVHRDP